MNYRADINALRALSVMLVVLFHYQIFPLTAGFIGVDVFFVISGFLMTGIITNKMQANSFSIIEFYGARAKRLIPALTALTALCLVLLLFGWFFLAPEDLHKLAGHISSSITFTSNITYANESGYFDLDSSEKWLLHTWSLSVEWQFYLFFPLILYISNKIPLKNANNITIITLFAVSILLSLYYYTIDYKNTYYFLSTRAWEMLAGGMTAIYAKNYTPVIGKNIGLFSIAAIALFSCLPLSSATWPGPLTIIPVFATCAILLTQHKNSIYNNKIITQIGLASYSIYIWHWPIYVLLSHLNLQDNYQHLTTGIILSVILGLLSKNIIENKFTHSAITGKNTVGIYLILILVIHTICMQIVTNKGYTYRIDNSLKKLGIDLRQIDMPSRKNGFCFNNFNSDKAAKISNTGTECWIGDLNATETTLLFGDSFAGHWEPLWDDIGKREHIKIRSITTNWCYPAFDTNFTGPATHPSYPQCLINRKYLLENAHQFQTIILAGHWLQIHEIDSMSSIHHVISELNKFGNRIILMPSPTIFDQNILSKFKFYNFNNMEFNIKNFSDNSNEIASVENENLKIKLSNKGIFINKESLFNTNDLTNENMPYSLDGRHISIYGSHATFENLSKSNQYNEIIRYIKNAP